MRSRLRFIFGGCLLLVAAACAPNRAAVPSYQAITAVNITAGRAFDNYEPVPQEAAAILGCDTAPTLPICLVTVPSSEEDSAFRGEGARLRAHREGNCRDLGEAILANSERVKMYPKALVVESGNGRLYGVGHTYELGDSWMIRVARRIDDLNDRSLEEKKRTLRHEMSHTIGAQEAGPTWTAEDYAVRCG
ncbi:MAG: hypothetical protein ACSLFK_09895 [Gemmatimonadaceae bacterium]